MHITFSLKKIFDESALTNNKIKIIKMLIESHICCKLPTAGYAIAGIGLLTGTIIVPTSVFELVKRLVEYAEEERMYYYSAHSKCR